MSRDYPFEDDLVSIVTPAWRASKIVADTIESVLAQGYEKWELLVVDDCSPDDTFEIVSAYAGRDARIRALRNPANSGPALTRNTGLAAARGRWIAFLDSDDVWLPNKLERTIAHAKTNKSAITFTGFRRMDADGQNVGRYIDVPDRVTYGNLLGNTVIATSTVLIDRQIVGDFRMKKVFYDDLACWLDILRDDRTAYGLNEDLMRYRVMNASVSRNKFRSAREVWKTFRTVENLSLISSSYHFARYAVNGIRKYRKF